MRFLEADNVVLVGQLFEVLLLLFPGGMRGGNGPEKGGLQLGFGHMYPFQDGAGVFQAVVEHCYANVDVEVLVAHHPGDYRRHLRAAVRDLLVFVLLVRSTANELRARKPTCVGLRGVAL